MKEAIKNAEKYRLKNDRVGQLSTPASYKLDLIENNLIRNSLSVNKNLVPKVEDVLLKVCSNLLLDRKSIKAYINSSNELQAYCYTINQNECIIQLSSRLISLLDEDELSFVLGHEIGHFLLGHGLVHTEENKVDMYISKYQELSADRIGVLACESETASYRALMKLASGLDENYLTFNVNQYLSQINEVNLELGEDVKNTHPSLLIRFRAILWFEIFLKKDYSIESKIKLEDQIDADLVKYLQGPQTRIKEDLRTNYEIWFVTSLILRDKKFDKEEQKLIETKFGEETLSKLINLFKNYQIEELTLFVEDKLYQSIDQLKKFDINLYKTVKDDSNLNYSFLK